VISSLRNQGSSLTCPEISCLICEKFFGVIGKGETRICPCYAKTFSPEKLIKGLEVIKEIYTSY